MTVPGETRWQVITGAPCSGKTTLLNALGGTGYRVIPEAARAYIDGELEKGRSMDEIRGNALLFQRTILQMKLETESRLPPGEIIFLDRGVPDSIGYYAQSGLNIEEPLAASRRNRYQRIFYLERLPYLQDRVRCEDLKTAAALNVRIAEGYQMLGYELIRVPVLDSVEDRVRFVSRMTMSFP